MIYFKAIMMELKFDKFLLKLILIKLNNLLMFQAGFRKMFCEDGLEAHKLTFEVIFDKNSKC